MSKRIVIVLCALALAGCSTLQGRFENRAVCTSAQDKAYVISLWGLFGIASQISEKDQPALCGKGNEQ